MPGRAARLHLPYHQWPAADQNLWMRAVETKDPFDAAPGARLAKASRQHYWFGWRRFLGFLAIEEPEAFDEDPRERLSLDRARRFATHLAKTNTPRSVAGQVNALYKAARIMMPECDWGWLKAVKARLYGAAPATSPGGPIITSVPLLDLGQKLMDESAPKPLARMRMADAVRYRDGLMIAMLAFEPLRRKNLVALEIGRHLIQEGANWFVVIPAEETKTNALIEFAIPELLAPYLANYLDVVRPRMLKRSECNALWISRKGGALSYSAVWFIISRNTAKHLGVRLAPHDVRDAAATTWAIAAPDQIGVVRDLLSHADLRTTIRHYNRAKGIEASRVSAQVIAGIRGKKRSR
jgi:integrase/recombinase XerD